ncbi:YceD family protein [Rathayibacter toxicus]|uniref:YceD family protein n=1 Tax=Rathayibacter toxicus TaxID=145458 RepID=UPI003B969606
MNTFRKTPFTLKVRDLLGRPGEMRESRFDFAAPEQWGEGMIAVRQGSTLGLAVRLESVHEGILASVEVSAAADGECSRCLTDLSLPVEVEFHELFAYSSDEAFDYEVHDDHVDLEPLVRDAVVLWLPFQPVCRPDCPGLDPVTGERLAGSATPDAPFAYDPRWVALAGLAAEQGKAVVPDTSEDTASDNSGLGAPAKTELDQR